MTWTKKAISWDEFRTPAIGNSWNWLLVIVSTLASVSKSHATQRRAAHVLFHEFYRVEILPMSDVHSRENRAACCEDQSPRHMECSWLQWSMRWSSVHLSTSTYAVDPKKRTWRSETQLQIFKLEFADLPFRALSELQKMFTETKISYVSRV